MRLGLLVACLSLAVSACASTSATPTPSVTPTLTGTPGPVASSAVPTLPAVIPGGVPATVIRVVDGDTLHARVDGKDEKIRVIGMDSPEVAKPDTPVECFAREASRAAERLLKKGDRITIQHDPTQDERDRFGRLLAHVFLADGSLFAETMIRQGLAIHYVYDGVPSIYADRLEAAQDAAKAEHAGLWSPTTCNGDPHLSSTAP